MNKKSQNASVVESAADLSPASPRDLARLRGAMAAAPARDEIAPRPDRRVTRDARGHIVKGQPSAIRSAVLAELGRRHMTRYELWKDARSHCRTLPESAVYEFLRGQRQIGLQYIEAILAALDLAVAPTRVKRVA